MAMLSAPATDTERLAAQALSGMQTAEADRAAVAPVEPHPEKAELVPVYAADPGDHEVLLDTFLKKQGEWEKYRTWEDSTTVANHESLTPVLTHGVRVVAGEVSSYADQPGRAPQDL